MKAFIERRDFLSAPCHHQKRNRKKARRSGKGLARAQEPKQSERMWPPSTRRSRCGRPSLFRCALGQKSKKYAPMGNCKNPVKGQARPRSRSDFVFHGGTGGTEGNPTDGAVYVVPFRFPHPCPGGTPPSSPRNSAAQARRDGVTIRYPALTEGGGSVSRPPPATRSGVSSANGLKVDRIVVVAQGFVQLRFGEVADLFGAGAA